MVVLWINTPHIASQKCLQRPPMAHWCLAKDNHAVGVSSCLKEFETKSSNEILYGDVSSYSWGRDAEKSRRTAREKVVAQFLILLKHSMVLFMNLKKKKKEFQMRSEVMKETLSLKGFSNSGNTLGSDYLERVRQASYLRISVSLWC